MTARTIALLVAAVSTHAQMSVSAKVIDPAGAPLPRGIVIFTMHEGVPGSLHSFTSERAGGFEVTGLDAGAYTVVVTCEGFQPAAFTVQLSPEHPHAEIGVIILKIGIITEGDWFTPAGGSRRR